MGLRLTEGIELSGLQGIAGRKRDASRIAGLAAEGLLTRTATVSPPHPKAGSCSTG